MTLTLSNHMACRFLVTFNYGLFKKNKISLLQDDETSPTCHRLEPDTSVQDLSAYDTERATPSRSIRLDQPDGAPASLLVDSHAVCNALPVMTTPDIYSESILPSCHNLTRVETSSPQCSIASQPAPASDTICKPVATSVNTVHITAASVTFDKHLFII